MGHFGVNIYVKITALFGNDQFVFLLNLKKKNLTLKIKADPFFLFLIIESH